VDQYAAAAPDRDPMPVLSGRLAALVPKYIESRRKEIQQLTDFHGEEDFTAIRKIAHNLKGTGESYGFPRLTVLGGAMQESAETCDADALGRQIHELAALLAVLTGPSTTSPEQVDSGAGKVK
jgi:HPt (histidine-containing phosphotransfer) domain-containing protein